MCRTGRPAASLPAGRMNENREMSSCARNWLGVSGRWPRSALGQTTESLAIRVGSLGSLSLEDKLEASELASNRCTGEECHARG